MSVEIIEEPQIQQGPTPAQKHRIDRVVRKFCRVLDAEKVSLPEAFAALSVIGQALSVHVRQSTEVAKTEVAAS
jgi:hypothetical protein